MKTYRFVYEYANHKRRELAQFTLDPGIWTELSKKIERAVQNVERGLITVDECMWLLSVITGKE